MLPGVELLELIDAIEHVRSGKIGEVKLARGFCYRPRPSIGPKGQYEAPAEVEVVGKKEGKRGGTVTYKWTVTNQDGKLVAQGVNT